MAADTPRDDAADAGWLDALAGRAATRDATAEALRDALLPPPASAPAPAWSDLEARAAATPASAPVPPQVVPAAPQPAASARPLDRSARAAEAANDAFPGQRWSRLAFAATVVLAVAVGMLWRPGADDSTLRGSASADGAVWRVADPAGSAQALAAELQALGAEVELQPDGASVRLLIRADAAAAAAVDRRLVALETALDAHNRLTLRVLPAPRP